MDVAGLITNWSGAALSPLPGLEQAWTFRDGGSRRAIAVSGNAEFAFQASARQEMPDGFFVSVLGFARWHSARLLAAVPLARVDGFAYPDLTFDSLIALLPSVAAVNAVSFPELSARTYAVFPGWECEVSGVESEADASLRFRRIVKTQDLTRAPSPSLRLAYAKADGSGTVNGRRYVMDPAFLGRLLPSFEGLTEGFVEFENYRSEARRIEWGPAGPAYVSGSVRVPADPDLLVEQAFAFLNGKEERP
ncbi:hypothetical protein [Stackebrandtia soli]|uniref:hypothetical protein n=1 Tax=Stackebrandtia soli TaxID=1892856 RepID=UPI0039EA2D1B